MQKRKIECVSISPPVHATKQVRYCLSFTIHIHWQMNSVLIILSRRGSVIKLPSLNATYPY